MVTNFHCEAERNVFAADDVRSVSVAFTSFKQIHALFVSKNGNFFGHLWSNANKVNTYMMPIMRDGYKVELD